MTVNLTLIAPSGARFEAVRAANDTAAAGVVLRSAGALARHAAVFVEGVPSVSSECQEALFGAGVATLTLGSPPRPLNDGNTRRFMPFEAYA